jgi:MscS family membrane protein
MQDIRRIVRNDSRIINKLHRRVFLDKLSMEDCKIYLSFYVEAANRDSFMAVKQDLLLTFVDCVERNGAKLATPRLTVRVVKGGRGRGQGQGGGTAEDWGWTGAGWVHH